MGPYINSELMEAMCDGKLDAVNYSQPKKQKEDTEGYLYLT